MWFSKKGHEGGHGHDRSIRPGEGHLITPDMLVRGTVSMRRGKPIRQIGVTVQGSTVLVTGGDIVDQETFEALVEARAIRRSDSPPPHDEHQQAG